MSENLDWNLRILKPIMLSTLFVLSFVTLAHSNEWRPVTGKENLHNYMSGKVVQRTLSNGNLSRGEYHPDGTGTLFAWGATITRT